VKRAPGALALAAISVPSRIPTVSVITNLTEPQRGFFLTQEAGGAQHGTGDWGELVMNAGAVLKFLVASFFCAACATAEAGYNVDVKKKSSFPDGVGTIAILPTACPSTVNCVWLEKKLDQLLAKRPDIRVIPASAVGQAMLDESISAFDDASRQLLAQKLSADSFMQVVVGHSGTDSNGAYGTMIGNSMFIGESEVSVGGLQVRIVAASDATVLLSATGHGKSEFRQPEGVLAKIFAEILVRAFPRK